MAVELSKLHREALAKVQQRKASEQHGAAFQGLPDAAEVKATLD